MLARQAYQLLTSGEFCYNEGMSKANPLLVIIDGHALIHRAFHALPPLTTKDGMVVNAVYGFTTILMKVLKDLRPAYAVVAFDAPGKTFRHKVSDAYKATRKKQPDELYAQIPLVEEIVQSFRIPLIQKSGFEADDIIGSLCCRVSNEHPEMKITIVTGDMDTLQLVNAHVNVFAPKRGMSDPIIYNEEAVKEKYDGLRPDQLIDFKALRGDASDNIPGVRGIGEKGAIQLLKTFGTLERLYGAFETKSPKLKKIPERVQQLLIEHRKDAEQSKFLATIVCDMKFPFKLEEAKLDHVDSEKLVDLFHRLQFKSLLGQVVSLPQFKEHGQQAFDLSMPNQGSLEPPEGVKYTLVSTEAQLAKLLSILKKAKLFCVDTETTSLNIVEAELLGIALAIKPKRAWYIDWRALHDKIFTKKLITILEDPKVKKVGHNIKYDLEILHGAGIQLQGIAFDTMIASYLLRPGDRMNDLDRVVYSELGHTMIPIDRLIGKGKNERSMSEVPVKDVAIYSCEDADFTLRLVAPFEKQLHENQLTKLLKELELPLIPVLSNMEERGVKLDLPLLSNMSKAYVKKIQQIEERIYRHAGKTFNIASPLQLREILFDHLKISTANLRKIKTGISTAASELEKLQGTHPIIEEISRYREAAKLKSTYIDALPALVSKKTGRLHTSFNQTIAATGRLSSSDPNLQNIPVRTPEGKEIRKAFIAEQGFRILSIDYSQFELRIVATIAQDKKMIAFFKSGEDIHRRTAAEIHHIGYEDVTNAMRYAAKEVNFGVLYGMGAFGLASRTGIPVAEAQDFIDRYFDVFSGIRTYVDDIKETARKNGYVETLFKRRRYLPEIHSHMPEVRAAAERMAINLPIQGTQADLLKKAMIEVHALIWPLKDDIRMILQVHDELVFEIRKEKEIVLARKIKNLMEEVIELAVPVHVDVESGLNWGDMKELKV